MVCRFAASCLLSLCFFCTHATQVECDDQLVEDAEIAMKQASQFYFGRVARHGGYVYHYSLDLKTRWGEGLASEDQIWIQPPGTPTVGMAFLDAYFATGDTYYLKAAKAAADAIVYGQLKSGGWQNCVDFDRQGNRLNQYRNGQGRGKNNSSFDDGQTQSALLFLIRMDKSLHFLDAAIHESTQVALDAVLAAQFPNGAFPQVWTGPVRSHPIVKSKFPDHDWRTEGRIKNYWDMYTLNDNVCGYLAQVFIAAHQTYHDPRYVAALKRLGDFLILAQMPDPQPGWAQQYNYDMQPIWARKFEPPGVSGDETQEALETLLAIYRYTGDAKYLEPVPDALQWLESSLLPGNQLARYYELKSNRPLYMQRRGDVYSLTYDDSNLPDHYGWKTESRIEPIKSRFSVLNSGGRLPAETIDPVELGKRVETIVNSLDENGRWVTTSKGEKLVGQPKIRRGEQFLSSEVFSKNLTILSQYISIARSREMK